MMYDPDEDILQQVDNELMENSVEFQDIAQIAKDTDARQGEQIRDHIAPHMWLDYVSRT